ncbi:MAG TPA: alpha/beta hydrolase [Prolixibacteraceae bacterium]|jgi:acetyl esterase/lipase
MRHIATIFSIVLLFVSCNRDPLVPDSNGSIVYTNVEFGSDAQQKMDIYLPAGRTVNATKTIVVIHGGSWTSGDKSEMTEVIDSLKLRLPNYAFINLNYRLAGNNAINVFPTQENDVKTAIALYLSKSSAYEISKDIIVLGGSAGAHLALLYSYKNDPDKHVKAVIDFFGPTDLAAIWNEGPLPQLALTAVTGKTYSQDPAIYTQSSPVNFINSQSPPTIAFQGGMDNVVIPEQTNILIAKLNLMGVTNQFVFYPNEGHGFTQASNTDALTKSLIFISKYVK